MQINKEIRIATVVEHIESMSSLCPSGSPNNDRNDICINLSNFALSIFYDLELVDPVPLG